MKTHNLILATFFSVIAFGSFIGVLTGATHQAVVCLIALGMIILLVSDNKKASV